MSPLLSIKNLCVYAEDTAILKNVSLDVLSGETHIIMGPNGSGKSTLASVLIGDSEYTVTDGEVLFKGESLLALPVEKRAQKGLFLAFQHPVELPGVTMHHYLRLMYEARHGLVSERKPGSWQKDLEDTVRGKNKKNITSLKEFRERVALIARKLGLDPTLLERPVNEGFSGGEKKKSELLQMALLEPELIILDEIDSGLDVDSLRALHTIIPDVTKKSTAFIIITHNTGILDVMSANQVYILRNGSIVSRGDKSLAETVQARGYEQVR